MRVITTMELATRCGVSYNRLKYLIDKGAIQLHGKPISAKIRIPFSGGYGFTCDEAAIIIEQVTGEDVRNP